MVEQLQYLQIRKNVMMRKIFTGILIAVSSILLILSIVGIILAWVYNAPLKNESAARLGEIDAELAHTQTALRDAKTELERTLRIVETSEKTLSGLKDELSQAKALFGVVNGTLDQQLLPGLKTTRAQVEQVKGTLQDLRDKLKQINSIPFVNLNLPGDQLLADWIKIADSIDTQITGVEDLVKQASTFVSDASYLMGGDLTETKTNLQNFLVVVTEYDQKVTGWRAQVATLTASLPVWIDRASIILTVFLLWFGFSQVGLILHGLNLWKGGNPLAVLRKPVVDDVEI
jgi:hypothetical protein